MINNQTVIDYAYPCMMAEKALKNLHNAMLAKDYSQAVLEAHVALVEAKMTLNSIILMKERENAVCE